MRKHWILALAGFFILALFMWIGYLMDFVPLHAAIEYSVFTPLVLCAVYVGRQFVLTSPSRWRVVFILLGAFTIGFVIWGVSVYGLRNALGLDSDTVALISSPAFLLGAYLGDKWGEQRNYQPHY